MIRILAYIYILKGKSRLQMFMSEKATNIGDMPDMGFEIDQEEDIFKVYKFK